MPSTINGVGTAYYGNRDRSPDGSYVTTLFFALLYVPLLPLRSFRVLPVGEHTGVRNRYFPTPFMVGNQHYKVERVPMNWGQVLNVYMGAALGVFLVWVSIFALSYIFNWEFRDQINRQYFR